MRCTNAGLQGRSEFDNEAYDICFGLLYWKVACYFRGTAVVMARVAANQILLERRPYCRVSFRFVGWAVFASVLYMD
jgi:hypothetical protein